jgi:hypothetical protein
MSMATVLQTRKQLLSVLGETAESAWTPVAIELGGAETPIGNPTYAEIRAKRSDAAEAVFRVEGSLFATNREALAKATARFRR